MTNHDTHHLGAVNLVEFIQAMFGREMELTELSSIIESFIAILQQQGIMRKEDVDLGSTQPEEIFVSICIANHLLSSILLIYQIILDYTAQFIYLVDSSIRYCWDHAL